MSAIAHTRPFESMTRVALDRFTDPPRAQTPAWEAIAESFALACAARDPFPTLAVLLIVLPESGTWNDLLHGPWVSEAVERRRLNFEGSGFSARRTLNLVEMWVRYLHDSGHLTSWERARLLHDVDDARECHELVRSTAITLSDRATHRADLSRISERFADTLASDMHQSVAASAVELIASFLVEHDPRSAWVRFGGLDPDRFLTDATRRASGGTSGLARGPARCLVAVASEFFRWLGHEGRLSRTRAAEIADGLSVVGLSLCVPSPTAKS